MKNQKVKLENRKLKRDLVVSLGLMRIVALRVLVSVSRRNNLYFSSDPRVNPAD
jgi:hypothetical protein